MSSKSTTPILDPDTIVSEARQRAAQTAAAYAEARTTLTRSEAASAKAPTVTPTRLAELKAEADHAALLVSAAEKRAAALRAQQLVDHQAAVRARVRAEAADDMANTPALVKALDTLEAAFAAFITTAADHNARVLRWHGQMAEGGIPASNTTTDSPDSGLRHIGDTDRPETITLTVDGRTYQVVPTIKFLAAVIHRATKTMPFTERRYQGSELVERDWFEGGISYHSPAYAVDLTKRIRESTGAA